MTQIIKFTPKKELTAARNLQDLVVLSRDHLTLWGDVPNFAWDKSYWPTTYGGIRFSNQENRGYRCNKPLECHQLMAAEYTETYKAYLRYSHTIKPHRNIARQMQALRSLELVLRKDMEIPDITKVQQRHFEQAASELKIFKGRAHIASDLLKILRNLSDMFIITANCHHWPNPYVGLNSYNFSNGARATSDVKASKLPDQDSLLAIAEIFSKGYTETLGDVDTMVTSITGLLLSTPMRIGEILRLREDCIAHEADKDGKTQYYLNYWVPKTQQFDRKPIPATMASIALEAVKRLQRMTEQPRQLARYIEGGTKLFYRHENCPDVADDEELSREQITQALGYLNIAACEFFMLRHTGSYSLKGFTLNSLWILVLAENKKTAPNFPYNESFSAAGRTPLKISESLMCCLRFQFTDNNKTYPVFLARFAKSYYSHQLSGRIYKSRKIQSSQCFFTRHKFKPRGVRSHSFRHLLNRLARNSGISIDTITAWSSRASSKQTLIYLNDDPLKTAEKAAVMLQLHGHEQSTKDPVLDEEAELHSQGPFHRSRYGLCRRSWRAGPCNKFADCLNCSELLMCKGDMLSLKTIEKDRTYLLRNFTAAQDAIKAGERSASRWTQVAGPQIERLDKLLYILKDETIPDGSPIELSGTDFNHESVVLEHKAAEDGVKLLNRKDLVIEYGPELITCLNLLTSEKDA